MLDISLLEKTSWSSGSPETNILKDIKNPSLSEFKQRLEEKSINVYTKKELMKYLIQMETKSQLGILISMTKEKQEKILDKIWSIDKLPISTFEKMMQSENLLEASFNKDDYILKVNSITNIERIRIETEADVSSKKNEYSIIVREADTVSDALAKMNYKKIDDVWYNCVFLLWENNKFLWIFSRESLLDKPPFFKLWEVKERIFIASGEENISDENAMNIMKNYWINAIPIIDESWIFYWVLSLKFKEKNEIWTSAILQLTQLDLSLIEK